MVLFKSEFQQIHGKIGRAHRFAFAIALIAVVFSSSVSSILRARATGCCGSLIGMLDLGCWI